jgi:hypothetical protein
MKWTYFIKEKIKIAIALAVIFALVLCTNLLDKKRFGELHETIKSVHKDRLLVENYVFNIAQSVNHKRIGLYELLLRPDSVWDTSFNKSNEVISLNINDFGHTVLTKEEDAVLNKLAQDITELKSKEKSFLSKESRTASALQELLEQHEQINNKLARLSAIQLEEGKKLLYISNNIITSNNLTSRLELGLLIVFGLVIQGIIISSKPPQSKFTQKQNLN